MSLRHSWLGHYNEKLLWCWPPKVDIYWSLFGESKTYSRFKFDKHKNDYFFSYESLYIKHRNCIFFVYFSSCLYRRYWKGELIANRWKSNYLYCSLIWVTQANESLPTRFSSFGIDLWYALTLNYTPRRIYIYWKREKQHKLCLATTRERCK